MLECVINVSEGRDPAALQAVTAAAQGDLLDVHSDPHHHRAVLTTVGEDAPRRVTRAAVELLDLTGHDGVHPRIGVVDVVPFVPLAGSGIDDAIAARDRFVAWASSTLALPCFTYGPERSLPEVRRGAFATFGPDAGPLTPHPTAGAVAVGARPVLVAYNLWLTTSDLALAKGVAAAVRRPGLRALGLAVGERVQVSMNLVSPDDLGPGAAHDLVAQEARSRGGGVAGAELVGLVPERVLRAEPEWRWRELDLGADRTIEARLTAAAAGG